MYNNNLYDEHCIQLSRIFERPKISNSYTFKLLQNFKKFQNNLKKYFMSRNS